MQIFNTKNHPPFFENFLTIAKSALFTSNPITSIGSTALLALKYFYPNLAHDFDESNPDIDEPSYLLALKDKPTEIDKATLFYERFGIEFDSSLTHSAFTKEKIINLFRKRLSFYYNILQQFNHNLNSKTTVRLAIDIQTHPTPYTPFAAEGGTFSISHPLIVITIPKLVAHTPQELFIVNQSLDAAIEEFKAAENQFIIAHELMHIQNNDCLIPVLMKVAASCMDVWLWCNCHFQSESWITNFFLNSLKSTFLEGAFELAYSFIAKQLEKQADLQAVTYLKTSMGAKSLFEKLIQQQQARCDIGLDLYHPTPQERLEAVSNFSKDKAKTAVSI